MTQPDYIDGKLIHVGTEVQLKDGESVHRCSASAEVIASLSPYLNRTTLRAFGTATWLRHGDGRWELQAFSIENFTPLDDKPLDQVLK
jgi:hypothetical protein